MARVDSSFDVLVLGAGSAGCVVAGRLAARGVRVGLVEAGPDYGPFEAGRWPRELRDAAAEAGIDHDWGYPGGPSSSRARVIGGCSSHNGCEVMWGSRADYDEWSAVDPGLSCVSLEADLRRAGQMLRVRESVETDLLPMPAALLDAAAELGYPRLPRYNDPDNSEGAGLTPLNAVGMTRWNAAFAYLDPVRSSGFLTVIPDTVVDRIELSNGRAVGAAVRRDGRELIVRAELVVVSSGAYGSPAILMRSGVGPAGLLDRLEIPIVADLPGVGESLIDHPFVHVAWQRTALLQSNDEAPGRQPLAQAVLRTASTHCAAGTWDLTLGAWSGATPSGNDLDREVPAGSAGFSPCVMKPRSRGRIVIQSRDASVLPLVEHGFLSDPEGHDIEVLLEGVALAERLAATQAMAPLFGRLIWPTHAGDAAERAATLRRRAAGTFHPLGTCRMGRADDGLAVTDGSGRVRGVASLRVVDASILPSMPRANTHITVVAVAEHIAAAIERAGG